MLGYEARVETERFGLDVGLDEVEEASGTRATSGDRGAAAPPNNPNRMGRPECVFG
jgi:hypothetical protein